MTNPAGSFDPGLRRMTPPLGVGVSLVIWNFLSATELSTAPCSETCWTITGLSGKCRVEILGRHLALVGQGVRVVTVADDKLPLGILYFSWSFFSSATMSAIDLAGPAGGEKQFACRET